MSKSNGKASLSWGDTFFLFIEREGQPLNIASACIFEGVVPLEACRRFIASKLPLIPRYTQRVVFPAFNLGLPTWEPDPAFDIKRHVKEAKLKHGSDAELKALTGRLVSERMDRAHPLWDFTLTRLQGNRTGIVVRLHHSMADGVSGVGLMNVVMDASSTRRKIAAKEEAPVPSSAGNAGPALFERLLQSYMNVMQSAFAVQTDALNIAREVIGAASKGLVTDLIQIAPELGSPSERLPFNQVCRGPQQVAWAEISLPQIKAVREVCGGTVNDVILTVITSVFARYSEMHGVDLKGRQLRVVVPVNVRGEGDPGELGNRITFLPINVPLDMTDPRQLLACVGERMVFLRKAGVTEVVGMVGTVVSKIPLPVQAFLAPIATQLPLSLCNTICTNVPGPQFPLYLMGQKMVRWYPYVPIGGEMGINSAVISYDGMVFVGFSGDVPAAPDLQKMEQMVGESFAALKRAAGLKSAGKKTSRRVAKKLPKATRAHAGG